MEKKKVGQADNLEAVSPDTPAVNEEERLEGKPEAASDSETWEEYEDRKAVEDEKSFLLEEHLDALADDLWWLARNGFLSPEDMAKAFKVTVVKKG